MSNKDKYITIKSHTYFFNDISKTKDFANNIEIYENSYKNISIYTLGM